MAVKALVAWVSISPYTAVLPLGASLLICGGTAPLRKYKSVPALTVTSAEIGKGLLSGRARRVTDSGSAAPTAPPAAQTPKDASNSARKLEFMSSPCVVGP